MDEDRTRERNRRPLAGRYALEAEIARGAIGTVWRARDLTTGEPVAVKVLLPETAQDPDVVNSLLDEAEILAQLNHPSIVGARDFVANGLHALVMDLVDGVDVRQRIRTGGPLRPADIAEIGAQIADALASVHAAGIVHGDVKPGNILVPANGGPAKLGDFGVARRVQLPDTVTHATPEYVAPEVVGGATPKPSSDVYSLGMVLYEMACGRSPYRGGSVTEVIERHANCVPVQPAGMPDELWDVVLRCVDVDPDGRPTAERVATELRWLAPGFGDRQAAVMLPDGAVTYRPRLRQPGGEAASPPPDHARLAASDGRQVDSSAGGPSVDADLPVREAALGDAPAGDAPVSGGAAAGGGPGGGDPADGGAVGFPVDGVRVPLWPDFAPVTSPGAVPGSQGAGPAGTAPASAPPMSAVPGGAVPSSAVPASGLPGAVPASGFPGAVPASGFPAAVPASGFPAPGAGRTASPAPGSRDQTSVLGLFDGPAASAWSPDGRDVPGQRRKDRGRLIAFVGVAAALVLLVGLGTGVLLFWSGGDTAPEASRPPAPAASGPEGSPTASPSDEPSAGESPDRTPSGSPEQPAPSPSRDGDDGAADGGSGDGGSGDGDGRPGIGDPMPTMPR